MKHTVLISNLKAGFRGIVVTLCFCLITASALGQPELQRGELFTVGRGPLRLQSVISVGFPAAMSTVPRRATVMRDIAGDRPSRHVPNHVAERASFAVPVAHLAYHLDAIPVTDVETLSILRERTYLKVGEPFSRHAIHRSVVSLYASAQFSKVEVYAKESHNGVSLTFSLTSVRRIAAVHTLGVPEELRRLLQSAMKRILPRGQNRLQVGESYHPAYAQRDVAGIKAGCAALGYFGATVKATFSQETGTLTYQITLGAPSRVTDIQIQENTASSTQTLKDALHISRVGEIYRRAAVETDADALVALYRKRGYLAATVLHTFAPETGILQFSVDAGKRLVFIFLEEPLTTFPDNGDDGLRQTTSQPQQSLQTMQEPPADIDEAELRELIASLRNSPFMWQQRVKGYFEEKGYDGTTVDVEEADGKITLTILPGTRYVVTRVTFSGNRAFSSGELLREMKTKPQHFLARHFWKRFFSSRTLDTDTDRLEILYRNAGYPDVKIETRVKKTEASGEIEVRVQIVESSREVIYRCQFRGNSALADTTLLQALRAVGFSPPQPNARFIRNDYRNAVLHAYRERGYMDATVAVRYAAKTAEPVFRIEGAAAERIIASLNAGILSDELHRYFESATGMALSAVFIATQIDNLWSLQDREGTARYTLQQEEIGLMVFEHHLLTIEISEGQPIHFGTFSFLGDAGVKKEVLMREVKHLVGTLWTPAKLSQAVRNLYNTGIFRRIDAQPLPSQDAQSEKNSIRNVGIDNGNDGLRKEALSQQPMSPNALRQYEKRDMVIRVEKQKPGSYRAALGYSTTDGFRTTLALRHRNLYERNIGVSLRGRAGLRAGTLGYLLESTLTKPWLFGRNRGTLQVSERNLEEDDNVRALQSSVVLSRELSTELLLRFQYNYRFLRQSTHELSERAREGQPFVLQAFETAPDIRTTVSSLRLSWTYDSSLPYLSPTSGMLNKVTLEYAGGFLRGETSFIKTTTDFRLYRQLFEAGPTVATALRLGVTNGLRANRGAELISFERFWAGGSTTVRGYAERGLGPLDSAGNHRGDVQFIFNTELRFPIYKPIRGVLFFDTGTVWRSLDTFVFAIEELPAAVGIGIRLQWGAFTGGVDYAVPLRDIPGADATPFYWRLGSTF